MRAAPRALALLAVLVLAAPACGGGEGAASTTTKDPAPTAGEPATAPPTTRPPRSFTLAASGDILAHNLVNVQAATYAGGAGRDYRPMFADIRERISAADLALCHLETPLSADGTRLTQPRTKVFNTPREMATALRDAGFDGCDTASNHTWDRGAEGVHQTLAVLDEAGLGHAGAARSPEEAATPRRYDVNGVSVAHLAYSYTVHNSGSPNTQVPPEMPWLREMLWPALGAEGILDHARRARGQGAEFVVVSMHWGDEYRHEPNADQRELARRLLEAPEVDLILGDHVHVVQPCERINGKYVLYGMGNFLSNQSPTQDSSLRPANEDGTLSTFTVEEVEPGVLRTTKLEYVPTRVVIPSHRIVPATPDQHPASYQRTVDNVNLLNRQAPGACDAQPAF